MTLHQHGGLQAHSDLVPTLNVRLLTRLNICKTIGVTCCQPSEFPWVQTSWSLTWRPDQHHQSLRWKLCDTDCSRHISSYSLDIRCQPGHCPAIVHLGNEYYGQISKYMTAPRARYQTMGPQLPIELRISETNETNKHSLSWKVTWLVSSNKDIFSHRLEHELQDWEGVKWKVLSKCSLPIYHNKSHGQQRI